MIKKIGAKGDHRVCSVARALDILGDRWTFLILREAFFGIQFYDRFQANLGIATNILSHRLKRLVENGIMDRRRDPVDSRRIKYKLTEKGRDLYDVTLAFMKWGDKWLSDENGPPLTLYHKKCGQRLEPLMSCSNCKAPIDAREVTFEVNPKIGIDKSG